jgi:iron complex outermembrane receptor protein
VMYSDDHLKDFVLQVFDWDTGLVNPVDYSGNRIAFFPNVLARLGLSWNQPWGRIGISGSHTGRIYIDNSETKEISIDPFTVVDLSARYDLPFGRDDSYSLRLQVNNLFDHEYESFGYSYGTPVFIPAAGRHMFLMLSFKQAP